MVYLFFFKQKTAYAMSVSDWSADVCSSDLLAAGAGQLRGAGNIDTANNFAQTTRATVCSIVNDGTAPASGTCQFTDITAVLTNMSGGNLTVNGLALASGTASNAIAGPLIIAEATIAPVTLAPNDTINVSWSIVT